MDVSFGSLARGDVDSGDDEVLDLVIRIHVGGDHALKGKDHSFPRAKQGLETHRFSRAGSRDGGAELLLTGRSKGPPGGFGQGFANHLLASDLRIVQRNLIDFQHDPLGRQDPDPGPQAIQVLDGEALALGKQLLASGWCSPLVELQDEPPNGRRDLHI